jgi:hypothetical protein
MDLIELFLIMEMETSTLRNFQEYWFDNQTVQVAVQRSFRRGNSLMR